MNDWMNYLTPTKKPTGYGTDRNGRRTRLYDKPSTPAQRLLASGVLSPAQQSELTDYRDQLNPAEIGRRIADLQKRLLVLAKDKTAQLYLAASPLCPARRPTRHPRPRQLTGTPCFAGSSYLRHGPSFAGTLT